VNAPIAAYLLALRRLLRARMTIAVYLLAALPIGVAALMALAPPSDFSTLERVYGVFDALLHMLFLPLIVFFIANLLGFSLLRQEVEDQTLHYLLLQPVGRATIVGAKFAAFLTVSASAAIASLWISYFLMALPRATFGEVIEGLFRGGRGLVMLEESGVLALGMAAYGALALFMGVVFRSVIYMVLLLGWESALAFMPSNLKLWTIVHHLRSMLPARPKLPGRLFEVLGEPTSASTSAIALIVFSLVAVAATIAVFRNRQCRYGEG
jgi:ABC-type transport system involved in multi-copper enzyme maturation permease subunit